MKNNNVYVEIESRAIIFGATDSLFNGLEQDIIAACLACCQNTNPAIYWMGINKLKSLSPEEVDKNFKELLETVGHHSDKVRQIAIDLIRSLDEQKLAFKLNILLKAIEAEIFFIRFYAEDFINQLPWKALMSERRFLISEYEEMEIRNYSANHKRAIRNCLIKILPHFSDYDFYEDQPEIKEMAYKEACLPLRNAARLVVCSYAWQDCLNEATTNKWIMGYWKLFSDCEESGEDYLAGLATRIKLWSIKQFPIRRKEDELNYLLSLQKTGDAFTIAYAEEIVLKVLADWPRESLFKYRNFLIRCQESKHFKIRWQASSLLKRIRSYEWVEVTEELLNWHLSGYQHVRKIAEKILLKIPSSYFSSKDLSVLLAAQRSIDYNHRVLVAALASRMEIKELKKTQSLLEAEAKSKQVNVSSLAKNLLTKIS